MNYSVKVVGNGLIAKEFKSVRFSKKVLVLASGVSNSHESRQSEFDRELDIIASSIQSADDETVLYFSTCSIGLSDNTPYIEHKVKMERYIVSNCKEFHIFRLPQVVGYVRNNTLISYIINSILHKNQIVLQSNAYRDLIDVTDVLRLVKLLVNNSINANTVINIATGNSVSVHEIYKYLVNEIGGGSNYEMHQSGEKYNVDVRSLHAAIGEDIIFKKKYWRSVLNKYIPFYLQQDIGRKK